MGPNDTIIDIDQQKEDVEANNSRLSVEKGFKEPQSGSGTSAASTSCNANIECNNEDHGKGYQETSNEGLIRHKDGINSEKVGQSSPFEYRPAPFSTLEEYRIKMREDIDTGQAEHRWFFENDPEDKSKLVELRSKLPETAPTSLDETASLQVISDDSNFRKQYHRSPCQGVLNTNNSVQFYCDIRGLYNVIICFLVKDSVDLMDEIVIMGYGWRVPDALRIAIQEQKSESPVFVRLLMAQQVLVAYGWANIQFETKRKNEPSRVQLCYVEFIQGACPDNQYDCILNQELLPRKFINVFHNKDDSNGNPEEKKQPALIINCVISAAGSHMATISTIESAAHLDWWELDLDSSTSPAKYPCPASTSAAHAFIGCIEQSPAPDFVLSLSWDGSQIALLRSNLSESTTADDSFPKNEQSAFRCYEPGQLAISSKSQNRSHQLPLDLPISTRHRNCDELKEFKGEIIFATSSKEKWDESTERLIASDGKVVMIYNTSGVWQLLHSIQLSGVASSLNATISTKGTSGGLFPWRESLFQLSLWSIESGRPVCDIRTQNMIDDCRVSFDGRAVAVSTTNRSNDGMDLYAFSTESGNCIHPSGHNGFSLLGYFSGVGGLIYLSLIPESRNYFELIHSDARNLARIGSIQTQYQWFFGNSPTDIFSFQGIQKNGSLGSTVFTQRAGSVVSVSYLSDILTGSIGLSDTTCRGNECSFKFQEIQAIGEHAALDLFRKSRLLPITHRDDISTNYISSVVGKNTLSFSPISNQMFYHLEKYNQIVVVGTGSDISSLLVWQLPTSSNQTVELLLFLCLQPIPPSSTIYCCPHGKQLCISYDQVDIQISLISPDESKIEGPHISNIDTLMNMADSKKDNDKVQLGNIYLRYLGNIINSPLPDCADLSAMSSICQNYEYNIGLMKRLFGLVLQHGKPYSWVPLLKYPTGSNPIGILLEYTRTNPEVSELVKLMTEYCIDRAMATQDITYAMFLCENMDDLASQYPDLALRVTRTFAFLKCSDRHSVLQHARVIQHPSLSSLWSQKEVSLDRCRNPILQLQSYESSRTNRALETFTEEIFVVPFSLLWTFIPDRKAKHQEYCRIDPAVTQSVFKNIFYLTRFHINPFRHVYIRTNDYNLTILDNPAIEALIQYKWNTIGFKAWLLRFTAQCIYYILIVTAAAIQIYDSESELQFGVFIAIISFSGVFLWLEFLQWKDYLKASAPMKKTKKKQKPLLKVFKAIKIITEPFRKLSVVLSGGSSSEDKEKETSDQKEEELNEQVDGGDEQADDDEDDTQDGPSVRGGGPFFFRSQYDLLDFFIYSMTFGTSLHHIIVNGGEKRNSSDLSFCIIFVFLHMLSELRVSEIVCKYVTIVFDILNEIKVFFMVLAGGILFFSLAILHAAWAPGAEIIIGGFPQEYYGAITTVVFIMGGRYDVLSKNLMSDDGEYLNWPLQVLLLTYFFFAVIVMLNVLIALVNAAYNRGDNNWRQVWLQNRLHIIVRAENLSYHIPGFRASHDCFPYQIYHTATMYQVRQYWRRIRTVDEEVAFDPDENERTVSLSSDRSASTESPPASSSSSMDKEGANSNDPDPSRVEQSTVIGNHLETAQKIQTYRDQKHSDEKEASKMGEDMTRLNDGMTVLKGEVKDVNGGLAGLKGEVEGLNGGMTGLKGEVKDLKEEVMDIKCGLTGLQQELSGVKGDIQAILAVLVALQQSQVQKG